MGFVKFCKNVFGKKKEEEVEKTAQEIDLRDQFSSANEEKKDSFFHKIKGFFVANKHIDDEKIAELRELFLSADFGNDLSENLCQKILTFYKKNQPSDKEMQHFIKEEIRVILEKIPAQIEFSDKPAVVLMCGINGNGKTSTIGKLANKYAVDGKKVLLAACDTFRAAAVQQLQEWAKRVEVEIVTGKEKSDPASVAFQACAQAISEDYDVLFIDTAGRLHNKKDLMNELQKIKKIVNKFSDKINLYTMLVVDANVGQNVDSQFKIFNDEIGIDGLIFTKLDGTTKGGSIARIANQNEMLVFAVSFGENITDVGDLEMDFLLKKIFAG